MANVMDITAATQPPDISSDPLITTPDYNREPTINPKWGFHPSEFDYQMYVSDVSALVSDWSDDPAFFPTTIVYSLAFIVGVAGNLLVVYALTADRKAHSATNTFLVSLAVADLLFLLLVVPYELAVKFAGYWTGVRVFCKLSSFVEMLTAAASIWNLTAVSIERYIVIVHPLKSRTICSLGNTRKIIGVVWATAALLSIPCLIVWDIEVSFFYNEHSYVVDSRCAFKMEESKQPAMVWYQFLIMFLLPTLIMMFCYSLVIKVLWHSTQELAKMTQTRTRSQEEMCLNKKSTPVHHKDQSRQMMEARKQVIKMLLAIIVVFLICWGPKLIFNIFKVYGFTGLHNPNSFIALIIIGLLPYLQSASNPIIYSFMSKNFRQSMRNAMDTCCRCCRKSGSDGGGNVNMRLESYKTTLTSQYGNCNTGSQCTNYSADY